MESDTEISLEKAYDEIAEECELYPEYYSWVTDALDSERDQQKTIADIGCGAGALVERLWDTGYHNLTGVDFSSKAVEIAQKRVPGGASFYVHDIQQAPLKTPHDMIFMTEVVEHLSSPEAGLRNVFESLSDGGTLVLTFPNRLAFFPWYHFRFIGQGLHWWPWAHRWFEWFTTPYEMRTAQPIDHAYAVWDVRKFLTDAGFEIVETRGYRLFPMFRISGISATETVVGAIENALRRFSVPVKFLHYRYMFICRKP